MSPTSAGRTYRAEEPAPDIRPLLSEETLDAFPGVIVLLQANPKWEYIRLKFLDSNACLQKLCGFTRTEMLAEDFDFLRQLIPEHQQKDFMKWLDDLNGNSRLYPYDLVFSLHAADGTEVMVLAQCRVMQSTLCGHVLRYRITGLPFTNIIRPFDRWERCYCDVARREFQAIYDSLSEMDKKLLQLLCKGEPSKTACDILGRSKFTVDRYRAMLVKRFNAKNCAELIAKIKMMGIVYAKRP